MFLPEWREITSEGRRWLHRAVCPEPEIDNLVVKAPEEWVVRIIRGNRCRTEERLFQEWAAALQFPYYLVGHNWNAFDECIQDLEWLPGKGYAFFVTHVDQVLIDDTGFPVFMEVLASAAKEWSHPVEGEFARPAIPFWIVFHCEPYEEANCRKRLGQMHLPARSTFV